MCLVEDLARRVIGSLPEPLTRNLWAFLMHAILGYTASDLSPALGTSAHGAEEVIHRGRRELRAHLAAAAITPAELADYPLGAAHGEFLDTLVGWLRRRGPPAPPARRAKPAAAR